MNNKWVTCLFQLLSNIQWNQDILLLFSPHVLLHLLFPPSSNLYIRHVLKSFEWFMKYLNNAKRYMLTLLLSYFFRLTVLYHDKWNEWVMVTNRCTSMYILWMMFCHDDVIKWKHIPHYWPFVWGIHWLPVNSPHQGQWRGALMFSLIGAWINGWVNNHGAGNLRCRSANYDVIVMVVPCLVLFVISDLVYASWYIYPYSSGLLYFVSENYQWR